MTNNPSSVRRARPGDPPKPVYRNGVLCCSCGGVMRLVGRVKLPGEARRPIQAEADRYLCDNAHRWQFRIADKLWSFIPRDEE